MKALLYTTTLLLSLGTAVSNAARIPKHEVVPLVPDDVKVRARFSTEAAQHVALNRREDPSHPSNEKTIVGRGFGRGKGLPKGITKNLPKPQTQAPTASPGLYLKNQGCFGDRASAVSLAITGAKQLAQYGYNTALVSGIPFTDFFFETERAAVKSYYGTIITNAGGSMSTPGYGVTCRDPSNQCSTGAPAVIDKYDQNAIIVCDSFFDYRPLPTPPCEGGITVTGIKGIGAATGAQILMKALIYIISPGLPTQRTGAVAGTRACYNLMVKPERGVIAPIAPTNNAESYVWNAVWAFGMGFTQNGATCPNAFNPNGRGWPGEWPPQVFLLWARAKYRTICATQNRKCYSASTQAALMKTADARASQPATPQVAAPQVAAPPAAAPAPVAPAPVAPPAVRPAPPPAPPAVAPKAVPPKGSGSGRMPLSSRSLISNKRVDEPHPREARSHSRGGPDASVSPPVLARKADTPYGLYADRSDCVGEELQAVNDAIEGVGELAQAALNALANTTLWGQHYSPVQYFFGYVIPNRVSKFYHTAETYVSAPAPAGAPDLRVSCIDPTGSCASAGNLAAFVANGRQLADTIVLCPSFFQFPAHTRSPPCVGPLSEDGILGIGGTNQAQILLSEFAHAVAGTRNYAWGTLASHDLVQFYNPNRIPINNTDSLTRMASWARDLGFAKVGSGAVHCVDMFQPGEARAGELPTPAAWAKWLLANPASPAQTPPTIAASPSSPSDRPVSQAPRSASAPISARALTVEHGLWIDSESCSGARAAFIRAALREFRLLAVAGYNALAPDLLKYPTNPAAYFFGDTPGPEIRNRFLAAIEYVDGVREDDYTISISCKDEFRSCYRNALGYVDENAPEWIVLCDGFFSLPALAPPCDGEGLSTDGETGVGAYSRAHLLLHEFMHSIGDGTIGDIDYGTYNCRRLLLANGEYDVGSPEENADSYAWTGTWAHGLGYGSVGKPGKKCFGWFPLPENEYVAGEIPEQSPLATQHEI